MNLFRCMNSVCNYTWTFSIVDLSHRLFDNGSENTLSPALFYQQHKEHGQHQDEGHPNTAVEDCTSPLVCHPEIQSQNADLQYANKATYLTIMLGTAK